MSLVGGAGSATAQRDDAKASEVGEDDDEVEIDGSEEEGDDGAMLGFIDDEDDLGLRASVLAGPLDFEELATAAAGAGTGAGAAGGSTHGGGDAGDSFANTRARANYTRDDDDDDDDDFDAALASPEVPKFSKRATMLIRKSMAPSGLGGGGAGRGLLAMEDGEDEDEDEDEDDDDDDSSSKGHG